MDDQSVVEVYRAKNGAQAHRFVAVLREAGIQAEIQGELFHPAASTAVGRLDSLLLHGNGKQDDLRRDIQAGRYFLQIANRRIQQNFANLWDNDDEHTTRTSDVYLNA